MNNEDDDEDLIAWRFRRKGGPRHGFLSGAMHSLCGRTLWMSDQDNVDPNLRRCGACLRVAKVRELKSAAIDWARVRRAMLASFTGNGNPDCEYCREAHKADPARYARNGEEVRSAERDRIKRTGFV